MQEEAINDVQNELLELIKKIKRNTRKGYVFEEEIVRHETSTLSDASVQIQLEKMCENGSLIKQTVYRTSSEEVQVSPIDFTRTETPVLQNLNTPLKHNETNDVAQNLDNLQTDYEDFKKHIFDEIASVYNLYNHMNQQILEQNDKIASSIQTVDQRINKFNKETKTLKEELTEKNAIIASLKEIKPSQDYQWREEKRPRRYNKNIPLSNFEDKNRFKPLYSDNIDIEHYNDENSYSESTNNTELRNIHFKEKRRPSNVLNRYPENDLMYKKTRPGNSTYRDTVKFGRKTYVIGTSMVKISNRELNKKLTKNSTRVRPFQGATLKQLQYYVIPTLTDDTPDSIIIQGGCNDISNPDRTPRAIANDIIEIGNLCQQYGVNDVLVSSIICRKSPRLQEKVCATNIILQEECRKHGYIFINNSNIPTDCLCYDGLHLNQSGKDLLISNYASYLNSLC